MPLLTELEFNLSSHGYKDSAPLGLLRVADPRSTPAVRRRVPKFEP